MIFAINMLLSFVQLVLKLFQLHKLTPHYRRKNNNKFKKKLLDVDTKDDSMYT